MPYGSEDKLVTFESSIEVKRYLNVLQLQIKGQDK